MWHAVIGRAPGARRGRVRIHPRVPLCRAARYSARPSDVRLPGLAKERTPYALSVGAGRAEREMWPDDVRSPILLFLAFPPFFGVVPSASLSLARTHVRLFSGSIACSLAVVNRVVRVFCRFFRRRLGVGPSFRAERSGVEKSAFRPRRQPHPSNESPATKP